MSDTIRDASSLILAREGPKGPQLYMVKRRATHVFMARAQVFVGGRVDDGDTAPELLARCRGPSADELAARLGLATPKRAVAHYVAAMREAFEESAILLAEGASGAPLELAAETSRALRAALVAKERSFASILEQLDAFLPLGALRYLAHWITPSFEPRQYDTRFFVAAAPAGQRACAELGETEGGGFLRAEEVLARHERLELVLAPPTLVLLEAMCGAPSVAALLARAGDRPVSTTQPRLLSAVEPRTLVLPPDHRYDDPTSTHGAVDAVVLRGGRWVHERHGDI